MGPHRVVHCRNNEYFRLGGEQDGGQKITRLAGRGARDEVGGRRGDDDRVRFTCEPDVIEGAAGIEQPAVHGASGEGFKGEAADELAAGRREHDVHLRPRLA